MSSQRPFFLSTFFAAFRQQAPSSLSASTTSGQPNKHTHSHTHAHGHPQTGASPPRTISGVTAAAAAAAAAASSTTPPGASVLGQLPLHSPRGGGGRHQPHHVHNSPSPGAIPIPHAAGRSGGGRRRGSDSSSEGFRDALGAEKLYIGGRTAAGEEKFFKLGVVRRVRSRDRLSLDRLSL